MFTQIAPRYDLLNHLLSMQLDRVWRGRAANHLASVFAARGAERHAELKRHVLDLCCGTADLGITVNRKYHSARVVGADFAHSMLLRARKKSDRQHSPNLVQLRPIRFVEADALRLPFANNSFDLVTTAFGFRNLANYETGLKEIRRVLKPGGTLAILEFTEPPPGVLGDLYRWYCRKLLPRIGGLLSGNHNAYEYLPASVSRFFRADELATLMTETGYDSVQFQIWTFGTVALHTGTRRP
jgi:demethylmenaquinone methyltransferase/2-methoxy-6-polyprenyl-1,4-benzoquinol methylase